MQVTGRELNYEFLGKPNAAPYELAERLLFNQAVEIGLIDSQQSPADGKRDSHDATKQDGAPGGNCSKGEPSMPVRGGAPTWLCLLERASSRGTRPMMKSSQQMW